MKHKRWFEFLLFILVLLPGTALANSMPVWIEEGQVGGMSFTVSEQPIAVKREVLTFSLAKDKSKMMGKAFVRAAYDLVNRGEAEESVTMIFPILFWPDEVDTLGEKLRITVDFEPVECRYAMMEFNSGITKKPRYPNLPEDKAFVESCHYENILSKMEQRGTTLEQFVAMEVTALYDEQYSYPDNNQPLMMLLVMYEVPFAPNQGRHVEVTYAQRAETRSDNEPEDQIVRLFYLLNPAKAFSEFGTLEIIVNAHWPDVSVAANGFAFERLPNGSYRAVRQGLPEEDLRLSVWVGSPPSPGLDFQEIAREYSITMFFVALFLASLAILIMLAVFYVRGRRKQVR